MSILLTALLLAFTTRRLVLIVAALLPPRRSGSVGDLPRVSVLVACRNEAEKLPGLLAAVDSLEYPSERLNVVLIDDASVDETEQLMGAWAAERQHATVRSLDRPSGKATALNQGLDLAKSSKIIVVYDADQRPGPDSLIRLVVPFHDHAVGAVSGYRRPLNPMATLASRGGALESYVYQLVIQSGRDRLGLNPPTMGGNCAYRLQSLRSIGGFPDGSIVEDTDVSLAIIGLGQQTRFIRNAVADSAVSASWQKYWNQRMRWTRGNYRAMGRAGIRLESWMVALGYVDRLILLAALSLALAGAMNPAWPALYLSMPLLAVLVAIVKAGQLRAAPFYLLALPAQLIFEFAATLTATVKSLLRRPLKW